MSPCVDVPSAHAEVLRRFTRRNVSWAQTAVMVRIRSLAVVRCSKVYVLIATVTCEICLAKHIMACKTYVCLLLISLGGIEQLWTTVIRYAR